jgi:two-component system KDP operon response regulator KdpE
MNQMNKFVIIEDSDDMVETITLVLQVRYPDAEIISTGMGREGIELVRKERPTLVILDLGLPDINGFEVLKGLRSFSDVPVIILTVRKDEEDVVRGLELGASDYVVKPFRQMELLARVNVQIKKDSVAAEKSQVVCGELKLDLNSQTIQINGNSISLTPIETRLMKCLMDNAGTILNHGALAKAVWDNYHQDASYDLKAHIRHLRKKIEVDPSNPNIILTKAHVGYYIPKPQ